MLTAEEGVARLREAGLRLTPQRLALIDVLAGDTSHPIAEDVANRVAERVPGVSLSTVYTTLHEFARLGLVREIDAPGSMRFDPETRDHAHLTCDRCGAVIDIAVSPGGPAMIAEIPGARIDRVDIIARGLCPACAAH